jgi:L-ascorbate metabolism protein UlaG (beta-lactamase superfamily)
VIRLAPLLLAIIALAGCSDASESVAQAPENENRVVSILNAGIRAEFGEAKFLFDPLYDNHFGSFAEMGPELIERIIAGDAPYDGVDTVFVSHAHGDHFSAEYLNRMLTAQSNVRLVVPGQAVEVMRASPLWQEALADRIIPIELENGGPPHRFELAGAYIEAFRTPHTGWPDWHIDTHNITFRVSSDTGARILHLGDADLLEEHFAPSADALASKRTDIAFVPYWSFSAARIDELVDQTLNADAAVGVHVPAEVPQSLEQSGHDYFSGEGQERVIEAGS